MPKNKITALLIANRGEIACRIIRTAKKLGIRCVAVATQEEANSQWCLAADQSCILTGTLGYRDQKQLVALAKKTKCQAIHPGYGFLAESAEFAQYVKKNNLIFIGPSAQSITKLGNKVNARILAAKANVPLLDSIACKANNSAQIKKQADKLGYPFVVKAALGGGGRGMRIVKSSSELKSQLEAAQREVKALFGDRTVYLERYLEGARHIEVQIVGDQHGHIFHLYDRDCSSQRAYQKIIEEAPAPNISLAIRQKIYQAALKLCKASNYYSLGTVEFLLDKHENFYLLEVNTRLQVEHPVTEEITGLDLVELQIKIAQAESLKDLKVKEFDKLGSSIEARVCAEAAEDNFQPTPGEILSLSLPQGIRTECGFIAGDSVSSLYDSLVAKLISWGEDREQALNKLRSALSQFEITGIRTNLSLLSSILKSTQFTKNKLTLNLVKECLSDLAKNNFELDLVAACYCILPLIKGQSAETETSSLGKNIGFRLYGSATFRQSCTIFGREFTVLAQIHSANTFTISGTNQNKKTALFRCQLIEHSLNKATVIINQESRTLSWLKHEQNTWLSLGSGWYKIEPAKHLSSTQTASELALKITSPLPGKIIELSAKEGSSLSKNQTIAVLESMKMEHQIKAQDSCKIEKLCVKLGQIIQAGEQIAVVSK